MKYRFFPLTAIVFVGIGLLVAYFTKEPLQKPLPGDTPAVQITPVKFASGAERIKAGITPGTEWMSQLKEDEIKGFGFDEYRRPEMPASHSSGSASDHPVSIPAGIMLFSYSSIYDPDTGVEEIIRSLKSSYYLDESYNSGSSATLSVVFKKGDRESIRVECRIDHDRKIIYGDHWQSSEFYKMVREKWSGGGRIKIGVIPGTEWMAELNKDEIETFAFEEMKDGKLLSHLSRHDPDTKVEDVIRWLKRSGLLKNPTSKVKTSGQHFVVVYKEKNRERTKVPCFIDHDREIIYGEYWLSGELYRMLKRWSSTKASSKPHF